MAMAGGKDEAPFVNQQQVQQDVETLYRAGAGKVGTVRCILHLTSLHLRLY
jgi:annexin A7/11